MRLPDLTPEEGRRNLAALQAQNAPPPDINYYLEGLDDRPPVIWLGRVRALQRSGYVAEANALLAQFRRRFPGELIPPDLQ